MERSDLSKPTKSYEVYLEIGQKKTFAVALHWPGWCRWGKGEGSAIQAMLDSAPRYSLIPQAANLEFQIPEASSSLNIVKRLEGDATTDFGAPSMSLPDDWEPIEHQELDRMKSILTACWHTFDKAVEVGEGKELRKGPRGGGRDLARIVEHVVGAEEGYLKVLGWVAEAIKGETTGQRKLRIRDEVFRGLEAAADGQLPREGPRGGKRWSPRTFVRRLAWHALDHAWEIEDRIIH